MTHTLHQQAREALDAGHRDEARRLLREATRQAPDDYQTWLLLAHATPEPRAALAYVERAYALQPHSPAVRRARLALAQQLEQAGGQRKRPFLRPLLFAFLALAILAAAGLWLTRAFSLAGGSAARLAFAAEANAAADQQPRLAANIAKTTPDVSATVAAAVAAIAATETAAAPTPTPPPTETPVPTATLAPGAGQGEAAAPASGWSIRPTGVGPNDRWIDVNLTTQTLVAYEGDVPFMTALISSGTWQHPTVAGQFRTWLKYESQTMNGYLLGYDYYLENVPYVMYFFQDYAIHGAYWHNNFGTPMSHGCVNMSPYEAGLLFEWAPLGTLVNVHY